MLNAGRVFYHVTISGISHIPAATTANDYTKMMGDKNVFGMGYMFPNYMQHMQQVIMDASPFLHNSTIIFKLTCNAGALLDFMVESYQSLNDKLCVTEINPCSDSNHCLTIAPCFRVKVKPL